MRNSSKNKIYNNSLASQSEVINPSTSSKHTPKQETAAGNNKGKLQPKKSLSSLTESSAHTISDVNAAHSYKQKQEQIIEMIQSNMKRSEDIQQSLTSGSKFFQSVNAQPPAVIHDFSSSYEKKPFELANSADQHERSGGKTEEGDEVVHLPGLKAPTPSKASSALKSGSFTGVGSGLIDNANQADVPLFQPSSSLKPVILKEKASTGTWQEQHTGEVVEDVFNDAQLLQKRIASEENTPAMDDRMSLLPEIKPAQQPECGSSSENGTFGQEETHSPINIMGTIM